MVNLWTDYPQARDIAFDARLGEYARQLSRCRYVRIYHDHAMIKPPGQVSKQTNWHQDAPYWPMDPVGALSAWIAVGRRHDRERLPPLRARLALTRTPRPDQPRKR